MFKQKHLVIRGIHTEKCLGLKLFGTVPEGGFTEFAAICREHKLKWNPLVKMWFVYKDQFESESKAIVHIHNCLLRVYEAFKDKVGHIESDNSAWMKAPKLKKKPT